MSDLRTAARQALEALDGARRYGFALKHTEVDALLDALGAALAEPQSTHSADCYQWHHACAVAEVKWLRAAIAKAEGEKNGQT